MTHGTSWQRCCIPTADGQGMTTVSKIIIKRAGRQCDRIKKYKNHTCTESSSRIATSFIFSNRAGRGDRVSSAPLSASSCWNSSLNLGRSSGSHAKHGKIALKYTVLIESKGGCNRWEGVHEKVRNQRNPISRLGGIKHCGFHIENPA